MQTRIIAKIAFVLSIAACVVTGGLAAEAVYHSIPTADHVSVLKPPAARAVPAATPSATPAPYSGPVALAVAATGTMTYSPTLQPTDFVNVFQLIDPAHGYLATGGTTYLIAHSYAKGFGAPGNTWEKLVVGDVVAYAGHYYQINRISQPAKGGIASEPVWNNDPQMLVMITCTSRGPGNPATNNYVIRLEELA
jgi:hypothetical protein